MTELDKELNYFKRHCMRLDLEFRNSEELQNFILLLKEQQEQTFDYIDRLPDECKKSAEGIANNTYLSEAIEFLEQVSLS